MSEVLKSETVDCTVTKSVLHVGDSKHAYSHIEYWQQIFQTHNVPLVYIVRDFNVYKKLQATYPMLQMCYAKSPLNVEELVNNFERLKVVFYSGNTSNNIHLLRFNKYEHIYLGSRHSERLSSPTKYRRVYDSIWVAGSQEVQKYKDANIGLFDMHKVGKPSLRPILEKVRNTKEVYRKGVLYLIDKQSSNASSMHLAGDIIRLLDDRYTNVSVLVREDFEKNVRLHSSFEILSCSLHKRIKISQYAELTPNLSYNHYIITDASLFSLELLALSRPIILFFNKKNNKISSKDMDYYDGFDFCYKFEDIAELENILDNLQGEDVLLESREAKMNALIGRDETLKNHFLKRLKVYDLTQ